MLWVWIGLGGAVGSMLRHAMSQFNGHWPMGTAAANALGSFGLAVVFVLCEGKQLLGVDARLVLGTGVMGGFTTYSTFNLETLRMLQEGHMLKGGLYAAGTLVTCLVFGATGLFLARLLLR